MVTQNISEIYYADQLISQACLIMHDFLSISEYEIKLHNWNIQWKSVHINSIEVLTNNYSIIVQDRQNIPENSAQTLLKFIRQNIQAANFTFIPICVATNWVYDNFDGSGAPGSEVQFRKMIELCHCHTLLYKGRVIENGFLSLFPVELIRIISIMSKLAHFAVRLSWKSESCTADYESLETGRFADNR